VLQGNSQSGDVVCGFFCPDLYVVWLQRKQPLLNILGVHGFRILTVILIVHYGFPQL